MADDREMTAKEIEQELGIPANRIQYWIQNGLPATMRGGVWFVKISDLKPWMDENVEATTTYRLKKDIKNKAD